MKFTKNNTLNEIVRQARPEFKLFWTESILQYVPEDLKDQPISSIKTLKTSWFEAPFPMEEILTDANTVEHWEQIWIEHPLWDREAFTADSNDIHSAALMEYFGEQGKKREGAPAPAVIICPGGGYTDLSFHREGTLIADRMMQDGYKTFILSYRVSPNLYPAPQLDLAMAIRYVRKHADEFGIDPEDLMVLGFSAGGHLCACTAAHREEYEKELDHLCPDMAGIPVRPDKICLAYPVISFLSEAHEDSFQKLTGGNESLREYLSVEHYVDENYPDTFVWANADDSLVPAGNAVRMGEALREKKIRHKLNIYPTGEHGCDLGIGTSAEGWMEEMLEFFKKEDTQASSSNV